MAEQEHTIQIERDRGQYLGYIPDAWTASLDERMRGTPVLERLAFDMLLQWRAVANTASMPAVAVMAMHSTLNGYVQAVMPDSTALSWVDAIMKQLSRGVPELVEDRQLRAKLISKIATLATDIRDAKEVAQTSHPIEPMWQMMLEDPAFRLSLWSSQRVAYQGFWNVYEEFLVRCARRASGDEELRCMDGKFKGVLRTAFGAHHDILDPCWTCKDIYASREVRNALTHSGGRITEPLAKLNHGIEIIDGVLQILPDDTHRLLLRLRIAIDALVSVAMMHPAFSTG